MQKSDFHMTPHVEIIKNAAIWRFFDVRAIFWKKLVKLKHEIEISLG